MAKRRISNKEFLAMLRENSGLYARTAKEIQRQFGFKYSRQAVRDRASKFPEELLDIEEENIDIAEEGLHSLIKSSDDRIKLKAIETYLKYKGRDRGYGVLAEVTKPPRDPLQAELDAMTMDQLDAEIKRLEDLVGSVI